MRPVLLLSFLSLFMSAISWAGEPVIRADVDATDLPRHLLRCTMTIPAKPGTLSLWHPKWIPGIHGPSGQIRNIGGLEFRTSGGERLSWRRDDEKLYLTHVEVPAGVTEVVAKLTYIANQPTRVSTSVDTYGNSQLGGINFNTCLLYPDGVSSQDLRVVLRVKLPPDWKFGTALQPVGEEDGWQAFAPMTLEDTVDSPLIAGGHFKTLHIRTPGFPDFYMHFVSESPSAIRIDEELEASYRELVRQCQQLFGFAPFDRYHFLVVCSDTVPSFGLEHLQSSFNGVDERSLVDPSKRHGRASYLLPHEVVHAWCGKFRRPAGMLRTDFHTAKHTKLLWVYEGLTQYLGEMLAVRSGLIPAEEYRQHLAAKVGYLANRAGRKWRSLEDTAIAAHTLRGRSDHWGDLRRNQDYYNEGLLFWMEVDTLLREKTEGKKSMDDFCHKFFGPPGTAPLPREPFGKQPITAFDVDEIVSILQSLASHDWKALIRDRIELPRDELPLLVVERIGYRIEYSPEQPEYDKRQEKERDTVYATYSLGLSISDSGDITSIVPGMLADQSGLAENMKVIGVNDKKFTAQRLRDALKDSTTTRQVKFLLLDGDSFQTIVVPYAHGPRYIKLTQDPEREDVLKAILQKK